MNKSASSLVVALSPLALAPAVQAEDGSVSYLYGYYSEDDLPSDKAASGRSQARYEIHTHRVQINHRLNTESNLGVNVTHEVMSGASPWYITPDANGKPVQVMTGASIEDERTALDVSLTKAWGGRASIKGLAGVSSENDYLSLSAGIEGELNAYDQMQSLAAGISVFSDSLEPTQGRIATNVLEADKSGVSMYLNFTQVMGRFDRIRLGVGTLLQDGYLSDPYKAIFVQGPVAGLQEDSRPDQRQSLTLTAQWRHSFAHPGSAFHLDYRFFTDDWEVEAHTLSAALYHQQADWDWSLSARAYSQSQAAFYAPFFSVARADGLGSSDYRLSPYGAISANIEIGRRIDDWRIAGGIGRYEASADYALEKVGVENPGLVSWLNAYLQISKQY